MMQRIASTIVLSCTLVVSTATSASDIGWQWSVAPYLWASSIDIAIKDQGTIVGGATADFANLVGQTEIGFQLIAEGGPKGSK